MEVRNDQDRLDKKAFLEKNYNNLVQCLARISSDYNGPLLLDWACVGLGGLGKFCEAFARHPISPNVKVYLSLFHSPSSDEELTRFAEWMKQENFPRDFEINLGKCSFDGIKILAQGIQNANPQTSLSISYTGHPLGSKAIACLSQGIKQTKLKQLALGLSNAGLIASDIDLLMDAATNQSLKFLSYNLGSNSLGIAAAESFSKAFSRNNIHCRLSLSLERNVFGADGAKIFAQGIKNKASPQFLSLYLGDNGLTQTTNIQFAGVMHLLLLKNSAIPGGLHIRISHNDIDPADKNDWERLAKAFQANLFVTVSSLGILRYPSTAAKEVAIIRLCSERNKLLQDYPEHSATIKSISDKAGLYNNENTLWSTVMSYASYPISFQRSKKLPYEIEFYQKAVDRYQQQFLQTAPHMRKQ